MTYKDKFRQSENRAHSKVIATKILRDMNDLRASVDSSPTAPRRWIWELIQNAKDVHSDEGVKIRINFKPNSQNPYLKFMHTGLPFTADNIRYLIEQISSKDRDKDEDGKRKNTGKFGTGFLATHLLSEIVTLEGVAKEPDLDFHQFKLTLDRSGFELDEITVAIQSAKIYIEDIDESEIYSNYKKEDYNTVFRYPLTDDVSLKVAEAGLKDLKECLPYTLAFVDEIISIEVIHEGRRYLNNRKPITLADNIKLITIRSESIIDSNDYHVFRMIVLSQEFTSIAIHIKKIEGQIIISQIDESVPKLFCDFPLIGTEIFSFPAVINNPNFNPTDPRDGIFLTKSTRENRLLDENKSYILQAVKLFIQLLDFAIENKWENLHLLVKIKTIKNVPNWIDNEWYNDNVLKPIQSKLLYKKIVKTANSTLESILANDGEYYMWFPTGGNKEIRDGIWKLAEDWFPHCLPEESEIELWNKLIWKECGKLTVRQLAEFIENLKTVNELDEKLRTRDVFEWLNEFYELLKLEDNEFDSILNNKAIFPNQKGEFCKRAHLLIDKGIDNEFKDILELLDSDIREKLLDTNIIVDYDDDEVRDDAFAIKLINSEINEKLVDRNVAKNYSEAFKKLLLWFQKFPSKAENLFPHLLKNRHLLYNDEEIMDNLNKAEQLDDLLEEFNAKDLSELRNLLSKGKDRDSILPITEEILVSMGITSIDKWQEAIDDKNLGVLFSHESTPTTDMFVYVQSLINKAKKRVIDHLHTLENYDLELLDDSTAPTVLAGIFKDGKGISIVVRPAYDGEVIVYYGSEKDILDFEDSELWIDDGNEARKITLGHILKTANIVKFPV